MKKLSYKPLYALWGVLFALTAVLGLLFPAAEGTAARAALALVSALFFLPPALILALARRNGERFHIWMIRWLSLASIGLTAELLCLNLMSARWSEAIGNGLHAALTVVSAPMVCSNFYVLPIFLWGTLLAAAFRKS